MHTSKKSYSMNGRVVDPQKAKEFMAARWRHIFTARNSKPLIFKVKQLHLSLSHKNNPNPGGIALPTFQ
jgi:hypothetical protein